MQYFFWSHIVSLCASQVAQGVKNPPAHAGDEGFSWVDPWLGKIPKSRKRQLTPVFLPGKFHGQRSLVAYSPRGGGVGNDLVTACTHTQSLCILLLRRCVSRCKCCSTAVEGARRHRFDPWVWKIPRRRKWQHIPVFLPGKSHGQKRLVGYGPGSSKRVRHHVLTTQQEGDYACMPSFLLWKNVDSEICEKISFVFCNQFLCWP